VISEALNGRAHVGSQAPCVHVHAQFSQAVTWASVGTSPPPRPLEIAAGALLSGTESRSARPASSHDARWCSTTRTTRQAWACV